MRPIFVVRAEPGVDAIRALRAWLKIGLRMFGLRCVEVREEPQTKEAVMAIDLTDTETQRQSEDQSPIPPGVYRLRAKIKAGTEGTDHLLQRAKNGVSLMLVLECTVVEGDHRGRKLWDYITCELDEQGVITPLPQNKLENLQTSMRLGRNKLRAIIDSAYKLDPKDTSEAAQAKRRLDSYDAFDGIEFWAQVEERPAANGYGPSNNIDFIITPDLPDYPQQATSAAPPTAALSKPSSSGGPVSLRGAMDDEIPFGPEWR
jgi:hypothetical protein